MNMAWDLDYDAEADVLYASRGRPQEALSEAIAPDILRRYRPPDPTTVGITILGFLAHYPCPAGVPFLEHARAVVEHLDSSP